MHQWCSLRERPTKPIRATRAAEGSAPQAALFIVTDGVEDKQATSCSQTLKKTKGISRSIQPVDITTWATIKSRGIKIAILYTEFIPLPSDSF